MYSDKFKKSNFYDTNKPLKFKLNYGIIMANELVGKNDWRTISSCYSLSINDLIEFEDKLIWDNVFKNKNVEVSILKNYADKVNWESVLKNITNSRARDFFKEKIISAEMLSNKINGKYNTNNFYINFDFKLLDNIHPNKSLYFYYNLITQQRRC